MLLLATHVLEAGERGAMKFRYGVEWGIGSTILSSTKCSYIADEGFLVESEELKFLCHMNGNITGFLGMEVKDRLGFRVYSGYMGLTKRERMDSLDDESRMEFQRFLGQDVQFNVCRCWCRVQKRCQGVISRSHRLQLQLQAHGKNSIGTERGRSCKLL